MLKDEMCRLGNDFLLSLDTPRKPTIQQDERLETLRLLLTSSYTSLPAGDIRPGVAEASSKAETPKALENDPSSGEEDSLLALTMTDIHQGLTSIHETSKRSPQNLSKTAPFLSQTYIPSSTPSSRLVSGHAASPPTLTPGLFYYFDHSPPVFRKGRVLDFPKHPLDHKTPFFSRHFDWTSCSNDTCLLSPRIRAYHEGSSFWKYKIMPEDRVVTKHTLWVFEKRPPKDEIAFCSCLCQPKW